MRQGGANFVISPLELPRLAELVRRPAQRHARSLGGERVGCGIRQEKIYT